MHRAQVVGTFAALLLVTAAPRARADCPASSYSGLNPSALSCGATTSSTMIDSHPLCGSVPNTYWGVTADHAAGTSFLGVAGGPCGQVTGPTSTADARLVDTYTLSGPGTAAIAVTAVLSVRFDLSKQVVFDPDLGLTCRGGAADARFVRGSADSVGASASGCGTEPRTPDLTLHFSVAPGQAFVLAAVLHGYSGCAGGSVNAQLHFDGLPPGYSVQSCKGFSTLGAVPVRRSTWGQLKQVYR